MLEYTKEKAKKILLEPLFYFTIFTLFLITSLAIFASHIAIPIFIVCGIALFVGAMVMGRKE